MKLNEKTKKEEPKPEVENWKKAWTWVKETFESVKEQWNTKVANHKTFEEKIWEQQCKPKEYKFDDTSGYDPAGIYRKPQPGIRVDTQIHVQSNDGDSRETIVNEGFLADIGPDATEEVKKSVMKPHFLLRIKCYNCMTVEEVQLPQGTNAYEWIKQKICLNCGIQYCRIYG